MLYKRGNIWWVRFQSRGQEIRRSSFTSIKADAKEFEQRLKSQYARIARGDKPRITFNNAKDKFIGDYFAARKLAVSSQMRYLTSLIALTDFFQDCYIDEINRAKVIEFANKRIHEGVNPEKDLACLSSMLSYMVDCEAIEINPVITIKRKLIRKKAARVRFLTKKQYEALLAKADDKIKPLIVFAVETGIREEEQMSLQWSQIDGARNELRLTTTKSGLPRVVPLSPLASSQISAQTKRPGNHYVFTNENGQRYAQNIKGLPSFRKAWEGALRRSGIKDFTWHDLRHTFASWAIKGWHDWQHNEKMKIADLSSWLGHQSLQMTMRYAHLNVDDLHKNLETPHKNRTRSKGL